MAYPEATHSKFGVFSDLMVDIIYIVASQCTWGGVAFPMLQSNTNVILCTLNVLHYNERLHS